MGMLLVTVQKLIPMPIAPSHLLAGLLAPALAKELAEPETGRWGDGGQRYRSKQLRDLQNTVIRR
jgi:hypothetical protein